ncbi:EAL domain-containing protein [Radiobacillus sp. PE A8.2]|uniref:EAL domain-containing protein n=1 Tax=Radiobacillus sp. PE A8.2 TaxID=3380349 RepID=UPI00389067C1
MKGNSIGQNDVVFKESTFNDSPDGVVLINDQEKIVYANVVAGQLLGYERPIELINQVIRAIFPNYIRSEELNLGLTQNKTKIQLQSKMMYCTVNEEQHTLIIFKKSEALEIFRAFFKGISNKTGESFLRAVVKFITEVFEVDAAIVGRMNGEGLQTLASYNRHELEHDIWEYFPAEVLQDLEKTKTSVYINDIEEIGAAIPDTDVKSCLAVPILNDQQQLLGAIAILECQPMMNTELAKEIMHFLSYRITAEIDRIRNEQKITESRRRYQEIIESTQESIYLYSDNQIVFANEKGIKLLGGSGLIDLVGLDILQFTHPDFQDFFKALLKQSSERKRESTIIEGKLIGLDHHVHDVEVMVTPYESLSSQNTLQISVKDVTEQKQAQNFDSQLRIRKQKSELLQLIKNKDINNGKLDKAYKIIAESASNSLGVERVNIWLYHPERYVLECKDRFEWSKNVHKTIDSIDLEDNPHYMVSIEKDSLITVHDVYKDISNYSMYKPFLDPSVSSYIDAPIRIDGKVIGVVSFEHIGMPRQWTYDEQSFSSSIADIVALAIEKAERKRVEAQVEHLAYYDQLTKLPNRIYLYEKLHEVLKDAKKHNREFVVMFFDLDQFKQINDSLGHTVGDQLLLEVAKRIKTSIREIDLFARMGGDEFVLILPRIRQKEDVAVVAERIIDAFKEPINLEDRELYITTSIGISVYPDDGEDEESLIKHADSAMYEAKGKGRNAYKFYSSSMSEQAEQRLLLEMNLNKALERKEFILFYQPIMDLNSNKMRGGEALIRWNHPELGLLSPIKFIALAEETGLIIPIGYWVIQSVCEQIKLWEQQYDMHDFRVAINISVVQFEDERFIENVKAILEETNIQPHLLDFEITESVMQNVETSIAVLGELQKLGIQVSLDDFGTGYSSLSVLKHLPINNIKIDKSFIDDLHAENEETIVQNIIDMSRNMNFKVVAEGIEREGQLHFLKNKLCDYGQGYLFNRPQPVLDFEKNFGQ